MIDFPDFTEAAGPGTELHYLLNELELVPVEGCPGCAFRATLMNEWGPSGCRLPQNRKTILVQLSASYDAAPCNIRRKAGILSLITGVALRLNPFNPLGSLLDLAIARAEKKLEQAPLP